MDKTYLSVEEAENLLPMIKEDVQKLMSLNKALSLLNSVEIEYPEEYDTLSHEIKFNKKFHSLSLDFYTILERLHSKGCYVKDLNKGLVLFFSFFKGREIFLCWEVSHKNIKFWHEAELEYSSRKPVSMLLNQSKNTL